MLNRIGSRCFEKNSQLCLMGAKSAIISPSKRSSLSQGNRLWGNTYLALMQSVCPMSNYTMHHPKVSLTSWNTYRWSISALHVVATNRNGVALSS